MKRRVTFTPQAWVRDNAIDVDPEGDTVFYVDNDHLKQFTDDALKYELEPYQNLPNVPEWIKKWDGPFRFHVEDAPELVTLERESAGSYTYEGWRIECPHALDPSDRDRHWYATSDEHETLGPFDTLHEVRVYLTRRATIDDWRGDLAMHIRERGAEDLADEIGGISDQQAMTYRDSEEGPIKMAERLIAAAKPPAPTRRYAVTIADTYTHHHTIEVDATSEDEARAKAERQYEETYDAGHVFEAFAMNGAEGDHQAIEVHELEPTA